MPASFRARFHNEEFRVSVHVANCQAARGDDAWDLAATTLDDALAQVERDENATERQLPVRACKCCKRASTPTR